MHWRKPEPSLGRIADKRIAGEARKRLKDITAALQISEIHIDAIIEGTAPTSGEER